LPFTAAFAALNLDDHALAVDVGRLEDNDFGQPQAGRIGRGQCHPRLETGNGFQKANDFFAAEHSRQLARLAGMDDPFRHLTAPERHTIEKTQGAHDLIQARPGNPSRYQVNLIGTNIFRAEPIGRTAKIFAKPCDCLHV
jgi:hypothetical protein